MLSKRINPIARVRDWKRWNNHRLVELERHVAELSAELKRVQDMSEAEQNNSVASLAHWIWAELPEGRLSLTRRNQTLLILVSEGQVPHFGSGFSDVSELTTWAAAGEPVSVAWKRSSDRGDYQDLRFGPMLPDALKRYPKQAEWIFRPLWSRVSPLETIVSGTLNGLRRARLETDLLLEPPDLIDFVAVRAKRERPDLSIEPFEVPAILPERVPARPAQRLSGVPAQFVLSLQLSLERTATPRRTRSPCPSRTLPAVSSAYITARTSISLTSTRPDAPTWLGRSSNRCRSVSAPSISTGWACRAFFRQTSSCRQSLCKRPSTFTNCGGTGR